MSDDQTSPPLTVVEETTPTVTSVIVKKPDLIQRILEKTGKKQADVKPVMEATLEAISEALLAGESLQVPPLGRIKVNKSKTVANGTALTLRMRTTTPKDAG